MSTVTVAPLPVWKASGLVLGARNFDRQSALKYRAFTRTMRVPGPMPPPGIRFSIFFSVF